MIIIGYETWSPGHLMLGECCPKPHLDLMELVWAPQGQQVAG